VLIERAGGEHRLAVADRGDDVVVPGDVDAHRADRGFFLQTDEGLFGDIADEDVVASRVVQQPGDRTANLARSEDADLREVGGAAQLSPPFTSVDSKIRSALAATKAWNSLPSGPG